MQRRRRCGEMRAQRGLRYQVKEARDPRRACPLRVRWNPGEDRGIDAAQPVEKAALACGPAGRGRARVIHEQGAGREAERVRTQRRGSR